MNHKIKAFHELTTLELFKIFKERVAVFIVEQTCPYQEVDDTDLISFHHFLEQDGEMIAYDRIYPEGGNVHIGRVIVREDHRKTGLGHELMAEALKFIHDTYPGQTIEIGAQAHLQDFYKKHGFEPASEVYLEDDIPHIKMLIKAK